MTKNELRQLAKQYLVLDDGLGDTNLIRKIQLAEGSLDCFATERAAACAQSACRWRNECLPKAAEARHDADFIEKKAAS